MESASHTTVELSGTEERQLVEFIRDRDVPCPLCGYNLRQNISARCPECGSALLLSVGLAEPFMAAWIMLAVSICLAPASGCCLQWPF